MISDALVWITPVGRLERIAGRHVLTNQFVTLFMGPREFDRHERFAKSRPGYLVQWYVFIMKRLNGEV